MAQNKVQYQRGLSIPEFIDGYGSPDLSQDFIGSLCAAGVQVHVFEPAPRIFGLLPLSHPAVTSRSRFALLAASVASLAALQRVCAGRAFLSSSAPP